MEKLIITHYITNLNDPFHNNLATRNPKTLNDIETLIKNDLQYLRDNQLQRPVNNNFNTNNYFNRSNKAQVHEPKFTINRTPYPNNKPFNFKAPQTYTRNDNFPKPEPMSVQTRQTRPHNNNTQMQCETFQNDENYDDAAESSAENKINVEMNESETQNQFLGVGIETTKKKF